MWSLPDIARLNREAEAAAAGLPGDPSKVCSVRYWTASGAEGEVSRPQSGQAFDYAAARGAVRIRLADGGIYRKLEGEWFLISDGRSKR